VLNLKICTCYTFVTTSTDACWWPAYIVWHIYNMYSFMYTCRFLCAPCCFAYTISSASDFIWWKSQHEARCPTGRQKRASRSCVTRMGLTWGVTPLLVTQDYVLAHATTSKFWCGASSRQDASTSRSDECTCMQQRKCVVARSICSPDWQAVYVV